jgi:hypothetical protein
VRPYAPSFSFSQPFVTVGTFEHGALPTEHFHIVASEPVGHSNLLEGRNLPLVYSLQHYNSVVFL